MTNTRSKLFSTATINALVETTPAHAIKKHNGPRSRFNFSMMIKAAFVSFFTLDTEATYATISSQSYFCPLSTFPYPAYLQQCPMEPVYNPCGATHFLAQASYNIVDAGIIAIGERHNNKNETADCVEQLTISSKKQTVLFEAYPHGMEIPCSHRKIANKVDRVCIGWDTEEYTIETLLRNRKKDIQSFITMVQKEKYQDIVDIDAKTMELDHSLNSLSQYNEAALKLLISNKPLPAEFKMLYDYCKIPYPIKDAESAIFATLNVYKIIFQRIHELRKNNTPYSIIAYLDSNQFALDSTLHLCQKRSKKACKEHSAMETKRNQMLSEIIQEQAKQDEQVIAIAGAAHFIMGVGNDKAIPQIQSSVKSIRTTMQKNADANPYAILAISELELDSLAADERDLTSRSMRYGK